MIDFQSFYDWVAQDVKNRKAEITIEAPDKWYATNPTLEVNVYVQDNSLGQGQRVKAVSEIDLAGEKRKAQIAEYEKLKAILEGDKHD